MFFFTVLIKKVDIQIFDLSDLKINIISNRSIKKLHQELRLGIQEKIFGFLEDQLLTLLAEKQIQHLGPMNIRKSLVTKFLILQNQVEIQIFLLKFYTKRIREKCYLP